MWYHDLFDLIQENADAEKAKPMCAYMRNQFPFLGIPTPLRKKLCKDFFKAEKAKGGVCWEFVRECWKQSAREFQYVAMDYLTLVKSRFGPADVNKIKSLALQKSWWDTIDGLDKIVGDIALRHPAVNDTLLQWSMDDNFWLRRIAIDHQLGRKDKTNTTLLAQIILNNLNQTEFFINKAIGWSLREYSKTDQKWVRDFVEKHRKDLVPLSIKEASKYI